MPGAEIERLPKPAHELLREHGDTAVVGSLEKHRELVATEPRHAALTGHDLPQPLTH